MANVVCIGRKVWINTLTLTNTFQRFPELEALSIMLAGIQTKTKMVPGALLELETSEATRKTMVLVTILKMNISSLIFW